MRRRAVRLAAAAGVLLLAACDSKPSSPTAADIDSVDVTPAYKITVDETGFAPELLTVDPGDVIEIENTGDEPHTATAEDRFDTGLIEPGDSTTLVLTTAGTIPYEDSTHPDHTAKVTVTP